MNAQPAQMQLALPGSMVINCWEAELDVAYQAHAPLWWRQCLEGSHAFSGALVYVEAGGLTWVAIPSIVGGTQQMSQAKQRDGVEQGRPELSCHNRSGMLNELSVQKTSYSLSGRPPGEDRLNMFCPRASWWLQTVKNLPMGDQ